VVLTLVLVALGAVPAAGGSDSGVPELRPDLVQRTPSNVTTREQSGRHLLGFDAAVQNHGDGPLLVRGTRTPPAADMTAHQLVERADGSTAVVPAVGRIRYTRSGGHDHWHFLKAVRYELRHASDHALVRPAQKTGLRI
jgi:hypothetical protein